MYEVTASPFSSTLWEITANGHVVYVAYEDSSREWQVMAPGKHHRGTLEACIGVAVVGMARG